VHVTFDARQTTTTSRVVREFDMVFYPQSPTFGDLCGMPYASKRLMLCVPEGHPLASAGEADLAQFANDPFIFMNTTAGLYEQTFHMCVEAGFRPWVRAVTTSGAAQMKFIQDGLGVGIVDTTRLNAGRRGTALVGLRGNDLEQVQCLACRAPYLLSRAGRLFMDFALEYFGIERAAALACFEGN
jgi:DNA-binding transcriptional LysR family regulator